MRVEITAVMLAFLAASAAHAGQEVGNGGNVVLCRDDQGKTLSIELLDYYEARVELGLTIALDGGAEAGDKLLATLGRLGTLAPVLRDLLLGGARRFGDDTVFVGGADLVPVDDSNHLAIPHGCQVVQIAIQKEPEFPGQKRFTVNKDLWDQLDATNKAGLMLHELLYVHALSAGAKDSVGVRYLNALISSGEILKTTLLQFIGIARKVPLNFVEFHGYLFKVDGQNPRVFENAGTFYGGPLYTTAEWCPSRARTSGRRRSISTEWAS